MASTEYEVSANENIDRHFAEEICFIVLKENVSP